MPGAVFKAFDRSFKPRDRQPDVSNPRSLLYQESTLTMSPYDHRRRLHDLVEIGTESGARSALKSVEPAIGYEPITCAFRMRLLGIFHDPRSLLRLRIREREVKIFSRAIIGLPPSWNER
jgi:hypothetical protein